MNKKRITLVELMLVVSILAILSSVVIASWDGLIEKTSKKLTHIEMNNIRQAIVKFKLNTGYYPGQGPFKSAENNADNAKATIFKTTNPVGNNIILSPTSNDFSNNIEREQWMLSYANLYQLAIQPKDKSGDDILPYDIDSQHGWNGPYIATSVFNLISITTNSTYLSTVNNPTEEMHFENFLDNINQRPNSNNNILTRVWALIDKISKPQKTSTFGEISDNLKVYKRTQIINTNAKENLLESNGMPYLLFIDTTTPTNSRLVSAGENKRYGDKDDIIVFIE